MSQSAGKGVLTDAVRKLHLAWRRCRESWSDATAENFEQEFIEPVDRAARQSHDAMDRLQSMCEEAKRACE